MNLDVLYRKLIASARANPPSETVPYGFEKRILARVAGQPAVDRMGLWAAALWRAVAPCTAVMVALCIWALLAPNRDSTSVDLQLEFESTLLASVPMEADSPW